jgi:hypothetical protein
LTDMFCPGTSFLEDGRIMVTGGKDSDSVSFYDPSTNLWSMGPKMKIPRGTCHRSSGVIAVHLSNQRNDFCACYSILSGYQAQTTQADGSVFVIGGSWSGGRGNKTGEVGFAALLSFVSSMAKRLTFLTISCSLS